MTTAIIQSGMNALSNISGYQPPNDPAALGWPPTLPIEIALKTAPMDSIREAYGYSKEDWSALKHNLEFLSDLRAAVEMVKKEGMGFKMKARLQAEELLKTSWKLIHSGVETPPSVKADLLKATMRWAGYDSKETMAGGGQTALNIQINLGG